MELCVERELCVANTYFKIKNLHKYTRMAIWIGSKDHERSGASEEGYAV